MNACGCREKKGKKLGDEMTLSLQKLGGREIFRYNNDPKAHCQNHTRVPKEEKCENSGLAERAA